MEELRGTRQTRRHLRGAMRTGEQHGGKRRTTQRSNADRRTAQERKEDQKSTRVSVGDWIKHRGATRPEGNTWERDRPEDNSGSETVEENTRKQDGSKKRVGTTQTGRKQGVTEIKG